MGINTKEIGIDHKDFETETLVAQEELIYLCKEAEQTQVFQYQHWKVWLHTIREG